VTQRTRIDAYVNLLLAVGDYHEIYQASFTARELNWTEYTGASRPSYTTGR